MRRLLVLLAACGDSSAPVIDAAPQLDADIVCEAIGECPWLDEYQRHIVDALGGAKEIEPGVTLLHRESIGERDYARKFLQAELAKLGGLAVELDGYTSGVRNGSNILATLAPTNPAAADAPPIIVGAHFDGVPAGPGAADNATGCAIVLASARFLLQSEVRNRPIVFALFDQEELGLIGSRAYAEKLQMAGEQIRGAHIFDMLAWDGDGDHTVELWSPSQALEDLYRAHGPTAGTPITTVFFGSSDHQAFLERSFPATGIGEEFRGGDHTPHYHMATDTVANVQFDHLARVTRLAFLVLEADAAAQ